MIKIILLIITIALAALGLTEFVYGMRICALAPKCLNTATVLVLKEKEAISELEFAIFRSKWFGNRYSSFVIAITDDLSEETLSECRKLTENTDIILVPIKYFENVVNAIF